MYEHDPVIVEESLLIMGLMISSDRNAAQAFGSRQACQALAMVLDNFRGDSTIIPKACYAIRALAKSKGNVKLLQEVGIVPLEEPGEALLQMTRTFIRGWFHDPYEDLELFYMKEPPQTLGQQDMWIRALKSTKQVRSSMTA